MYYVEVVGYMENQKRKLIPFTKKFTIVTQKKVKIFNHLSLTSFVCNHDHNIIWKLVIWKNKHKHQFNVQQVNSVYLRMRFREVKSKMLSF